VLLVEGAPARDLRAGRWSGWDPAAYRGSELSGATVGIVGLEFVGGWLLLTFVQKAFYDLPLTVSATDADAIGKSLQYFAIARLHTLILGLLAVALTFRFRSIVGGLIVSQALTLYTTPVLYLYLDRFRLCLLYPSPSPRAS